MDVIGSIIDSQESGSSPRSSGTEAMNFAYVRGKMEIVTMRKLA